MSCCWTGAYLSLIRTVEPDKPGSSPGPMLVAEDDLGYHVDVAYDRASALSKLGSPPHLKRLQFREPAYAALMPIS